MVKPSWKTKEGQIDVIMKTDLEGLVEYSAVGLQLKVR